MNGLLSVLRLVNGFLEVFECTFGGWDEKEHLSSFLLDHGNVVHGCLVVGM